MKIISFDDAMELHHCTTMEEDGGSKQKDRLLVHLPAAIGLIVMTGFFALWMILFTASTSTCIRNPMQL